MINQKKTANAIGGKTARACESCLKRRAKWFCAADDAFLCHACDLLVHSANGLASRHHRVCLDTSSKPPQHQHQQTPSWHHGFTKKARTPRKNTNSRATSNKDTCKYNPHMMSVVPEVGNDDEYEDDGLLMLVEEEKNNYKESINDDDQMIFSVPNLDDDDISKGLKEEGVFGLENYNNDGELFNFSLMGLEGDVYDHDVHGWEFPENELAEFAADVESLLEQEEEDEGVVTKGMKHEQEGEVISANDCDHTYFDWSMDVESDMFTFNLNDSCEENNDEHIKSNHRHHHHHHQQQLSGEEEEEGNNGKVVVPIKDEEVEESNNNNNIDDGSMEASNKKRKIVLRLNYDDVINAWASQGCSSPWTTGSRPEFDFDHHGWPYCMGDLRPPGGVERRGNAKGGDGGREARVSRYREKRRTRLFSKKIRYEVRKLNAEKRPRLKGRFVKRTTLSQGVGAESTFPHPKN